MEYSSLILSAGLLIAGTLKWARGLIQSTERDAAFATRLNSLITDSTATTREGSMNDDAANTDALEDDARPVRVEVDGGVYRGRYSVCQRDDVVYIDGKRVGVDVDHDGNPLVMPLPAARVGRNARPSWWAKLWWRGMR